MRKLIYYVACTVDGFIARKDGALDCFLAEGEHFADLLESFPETIPAHLRGHFKVASENRRFDTVLMGRRTYEVGTAIGVTNPYPHLKQCLFSRRTRESPDEAVELVSENALEKVEKLKQESGMDIWLCGGGDLATQLIPAMDELILKVNPFLIGAGIPLFRGGFKTTAVEMTKNKTYDNGFMIVYYRVKH